MIDVLVAVSRDTPVGLATPIVAALGARGRGVKVVDLGKVGKTGNRLGRVVQTLLGEDEAGRLLRELAHEKPRAAVALDPGALSALVLARDRKVSATPAIGVCPELAPGKRWAMDADRFITLDDEAAVALSDHGVDGARVLVAGPLVPHALHEAAARPRADLRTELNIPAQAPVVLVDAAAFSLEALAQLTLQLSLLARPVYALFDASSSADAASQLRRQVPGLGLKGKLFGETPNSPRLWRTADVLVGRSVARLTHVARAIGAFVVAVEPEGEGAQDEVRALAARGLGAGVDKIVFLSSALEPLVGVRPPAAVRTDGAADAAALIAEVVAAHEEVLAETFAARGSAHDVEDSAPAEARDVEELGWDLGDDEPGAGPPPRSSDKEERLRKELDESRREAERWDERRKLAERQGDRGLAEQATREADRKRARMHSALEELQRLARAPEPPRARPPEDPLAAFKREMGAGGKGSVPRSLDQELADLKNKMKKGPR